MIFTGAARGWPLAMAEIRRRIHSHVGQGTTVCLYMPRHHGETDGDDPAPKLADSLHSAVSC